jgi:hypothetical protein
MVILLTTEMTYTAQTLTAALVKASSYDSISSTSLDVSA